MIGKALVAGLAAAAPLVAAHEHHHAHEARSEAAAKYNPRDLRTARIPRPKLAPLARRDTSTIPRPEFGPVPYGVDITKCTVDGKWALSFDDGPSEYTSTLLDVLAEEGVKATFFVVGTMAQIFPDVLKREYAEGHQIGSHSWSHQDLEASNEDVRQSEVLMNEQSFIDILGFFPTYFRPPYTSCGANCMRVLTQWGYHVTDYDTDTKDYEGDYTFATNVIDSAIAAGGSHISLTHDIMQETAETFAKYIIQQGKAAGYQFVTLGECLGDSPANYYRRASDGTATDGSGATGSGVSPTGSVTGSASSSAPATSSTSSSASTSSISTSSSSSAMTSSAPTTSSTPASSAGSNSSSSTAANTVGPAPTTTPSSAARASSALGAAVLGLLAVVMML